MKIKFIFLVLISFKIVHCEMQNIPTVFEKKWTFLEQFKAIFQQKILLPIKIIKYEKDQKLILLPEKLFLIINELQKNRYSNLIPNRMIFYGSPGNGKTMSAKLFADLTNSEFISQMGSLVIKKELGESAKVIVDLFDQAKKISSQNKSVVIFIDEVDSFADLANPFLESVKERLSATQTLWMLLDEIKNDKNIFIILATNNLQLLHPTLLDRFGDFIFEFSDPFEQVRQEIFDFYIKCFQLKLESNIKIKHLVKITNNLSIRAIENICHSFKQHNVLVKSEVLKWNTIKEILNKNNIKPKFSETRNYAKEQKEFGEVQKIQLIIGILAIIKTALKESFKLIGDFMEYYYGH